MATSYYSEPKKITYDANTDYSALIDKAVQAGDWDAAKGYEEQRNAKLAAMNAAGTNTGGYTSGYYAQAVKDKYAGTDYTAQINEAIRSGDVYGGMKLDALRNEKLDAYNSAGLNEEGYEKDYYKNWLTNYVNAQNKGQTVGLVDENGNRKTGVTSSAMSYYDDVLGKLDGLYQQELSRGENYYADAVAEAQAQLKAQKDAINLNYDDLTKQHYIDREMAEKNLPQQLAALGFTGGLAESSLLGIGYDYENNLNAAERARSQQLTEQDNFYAQALRDAAREKANMESAAQQQYAKNYQQVMADKIAQQQYEEQMAYQKEQDALANSRYDAEWLYQKEQDALANSRYESEFAYQQQLDQQDAVKNLVAMGVIPTTEMIMSAYGLDAAAAEAYKQQLKAQLTPAGNYYSAQSQLEEEAEPIPNETLIPEFSDAGMNDGAWRELTQQIRTNLNENNTAVVDALVDQTAGMMSRTQWNELARYLNSVGYVNPYTGQGIPIY